MPNGVLGPGKLLISPTAAPAEPVPIRGSVIATGSTSSGWPATAGAARGTGATSTSASSETTSGRIGPPDGDNVDSVSCSVEPLSPARQVIVKNSHGWPQEAHREGHSEGSLSITKTSDYSNVHFRHGRPGDGWCRVGRREPGRTERQSAPDWRTTAPASHCAA